MNKIDLDDDINWSGYVVKFDEPDSIGNVIKKGAINIDNLQQLKICGQIIDYEIDETGIKVIKKFKLISVSL